MTNSLHVDVIGKGYPLIMLHGWGWNSTIWEPLIPQLSEKFQLFLIDLPGFGKSSFLSTDYDMPHLKERLLEVTPDKGYWLGWSLGGMIAWYVALSHPERVTRLMTVASSPKFVAGDNWPGVSLPTLEKFSCMLQENYQKTLLEFLELQLRGAPRNKELFVELKSQILLTPHTLAALTSGLTLLQDLDLRTTLAKQQCKSLHLFGSHDTLVPVRVTEKIQALSSQADCLVIPKSGHMPFLSQQSVFVEAVERFFL